MYAVATGWVGPLPRSPVDPVRSVQPLPAPRRGFLFPCVQSLRLLALFTTLCPPRTLHGRHRDSHNMSLLRLRYPRAGEAFPMFIKKQGCQPKSWEDMASTGGHSGTSYSTVCCSLESQLSMVFDSLVKLIHFSERKRAFRLRAATLRPLHGMSQSHAQCWDFHRFSGGAGSSRKRLDGPRPLWARQALVQSKLWCLLTDEAAL